MSSFLCFTCFIQFTTFTHSRKDSTTTSSKMKHLLFWGMVFAAIHISHSAVPEFCQLPSDAGEGTSFLFFVYYDPVKDQCDPFIYKGEGGNANRFVNERQCIRNCSTRAESIYPMVESEACHFKKAIGECSGQYMRYYYDSVHNKCKRFIWSGCIGNGNRFFDYNSCNATCAGIHDDRDEPEEDEPDTPIAIICGVLLAAIVASILITVIVLTVQSKKKVSKKAQGKSKEHKSESPLQGHGIEMA
ncbi:BPTI/Kunitz domain-containing protein isoform X2 [Seriola aureovittata]|uniref:BPTI/Kunitz domain-containing protein isoform X2 n=1 Tax=Seriola aureovittata TaxID=2871759 RepID=UPI0024BEF0D5|nr:BPTI/Kunitz domain-containing protein isoform X2 [Seriola aureovittata]